MTGVEVCILIAGWLSAVFLGLYLDRKWGGA